jgi:hypothetical protein
MKPPAEQPLFGRRTRFAAVVEWGLALAPLAFFLAGLITPK